MHKTISAEILSALKENPGEHDGKALYVMVRYRVEGLSYGTFRSRLAELIIQGDVKRTGERNKGVYSLPEK